MPKQFESLANIQNPIQKSFIAQELTPNQLTKQINVPDVIPIQTPKELSRQLDLTLPLPKQLFREEQIYKVKEKASATPLYFPDLPKFNTFEKSLSRMMGKIDTRTRYKPSLMAIGEGIFAKGKAPKFVTGMGIRPIYGKKGRFKL